jgi:hypothetical protein
VLDIITLQKEGSAGMRKLDSVKILTLFQEVHPQMWKSFVETCRVNKIFLIKLRLYIDDYELRVTNSHVSYYHSHGR